MKIDILDVPFERFTRQLEENGFPSYRAKQVYPLMFGKVNSFEEIHNIPKNLKIFLNEKYTVKHMEIYKKLQSQKDYTKKYLMKLEDGNIIECVLMKYKFGLSACISSQVGCRMGCTFCASTIGSKVRDLSPGEMVRQLMTMSKDVGERISNVVLMGSGEPFDNYENVITFLQILSYPEGLNIGQRHITISTCGLANKIREFADRNTQVNLAISLHASTQEKRMQTMPIAKKYKLEELMKAVKYYIQKTNRRVTYEYAVIRGVNDDKKDALKLSELLKDQLCHVNIIPVNATEHSSYEKPNKLKVQEFMQVLTENKINATLRREMGSDINGACGQLKISTILKEKI